jgi:hypothetical protein
MLQVAWSGGGGLGLGGALIQSPSPMDEVRSFTRSLGPAEFYHVRPSSARTVGLSVSLGHRRKRGRGYGLCFH